MFRSLLRATANPDIIHQIGDTFIKNIQYPPCITCKYFSLYVPKELYDSKNTNMQLSKCKKFGYIDIISGNIVYETVGKARSEKDMCKIQGIYHVNRE